MNDDQIMAKLSQIIRVGFVNARQPEKMRVKVTIPDTVGKPLITDFLPVLTPRACEDMQYDLPDIGDQVLCLFLAYGLEQGFVLGAMYGKQTPPVQSGDKWHRTFKDGTTLEYDREEHKLVANVQGDVEITATGNIRAELEGELSASAQGPASIKSASQISMDSPSMSIGGSGGTNARMQGNFNLTKGDVTAESVSLVNHVHTCPACGAQTSPPIGGASGGSGESGGNGSGDGEESGNENGSGNTETGNGDTNIVDFKSPAAIAAALAATGFEMTPEREAQYAQTETMVEQGDSYTYHTILCLPQIAEYEADHSAGTDRLGWLYLKAMFEKWLSGKPSDDPYQSDSIFWVSLNWALSYMRVNIAYQRLISKPYLFSPAARQKLAEILKRDGYFTNERVFFDYRQGGWPRWKQGYFQEITAKGMDNPFPDGLMAAMGEFQLRAMAHGYTEPEGDTHTVVIRGISVFIWDSFQFENNASLGYWRCFPPKFSPDEFEAGVELYNSDFRLFSEDCKAGEAFLVLSEPKLVDPPVVFSYVAES